MTPTQERDLILKELEERKVEDVTTIDVASFSPFASYVILVTVDNPRALAAVQGHIEECLEKGGLNVSVKEGEPDSGWVIIQGEEVIVHLLLPPNRRMLDLETLYAQLTKKSEKA